MVVQDSTNGYTENQAYWQCNLLAKLKIFADELDVRDVGQKKLGVSMKILGKALKQC